VGRRGPLGGLAAIAVLVSWTPMLTAVPAQANKPRHFKHAKGTLIVATYVEGSGGTSPRRQGEAERSPEPIRSRSIEVSKNGERIIAMAPRNSHTRIKLRPGDYEIRTSCDRTKVAVRPDRTTTVSVYCHRK
jgi:hypothetical protein